VRSTPPLRCTPPHCPALLRYFMTLGRRRSSRASELIRVPRQSDRRSRIVGVHEGSGWSEDDFEIVQDQLARLTLQGQRSIGKRDLNGRQVRMHLTLKKEATKPAAKNFLQQQARFDQFISIMNEQRPHHALNMKYPAELYSPSPQPGLPALDSPFHDRIE
jgi:hypothetical protein